jgi:hypothetical protein
VEERLPPLVRDDGFLRACQSWHGRCFDRRSAQEMICEMEETATAGGSPLRYLS